MVVNQLLDFTHEMNSATVILTVVVRVITNHRPAAQRQFTFFKQVDDDKNTLHFAWGSDLVLLLRLDIKNNGFTNS